MKIKVSKYFLFILFLGFKISSAQPTISPIQILITTNHGNWECKLSEPTSFKIQVLKFGVPQKKGTIKIQIGPEKVQPFYVDSLVMETDSYTTLSYTLTTPGFLRCIVSTVFDGKEYRSLNTIGYSINNIYPTTTLPADFDAFWQKTKLGLETIPIDSKIQFLPERSSSKSNVFHINIQGFNNSRIYGMLAIPKEAGKYPAVLQVPGAGVRPYGPDIELADKGIIVLTIGIHGVPVNMDPAVYTNLSSGPLNGYFFFNMEDKEKYYYKRVYANVIRANDFLVSLPEYDGVNLAVMGASQGGALSVVTAALDNRVKYYVAFHPALCDLTGYLYDRAGGWPHMFSKDHPLSNGWREIANKSINSLSYFDVVNFTYSIQAEGLFSWGFNDETCAPTSFYAAYNKITAKKNVYAFHDTGHWIYPEQRQKAIQWLIKRIKQ